jgi:hypothetical protein
MSIPYRMWIDCSAMRRLRCSSLFVFSSPLSRVSSTAFKKPCWIKLPRNKNGIHCFPVQSTRSSLHRPLLIEVSCKLHSVVGTTVAFLLCISCAWSFTSDQSLVLEAWRYVDKYYVDQSIHPTWLQLRQKIIRQVNHQNSHALIREMLSKLDDPYTRLLEPEEYQSLKATVIRVCFIFFCSFYFFLSFFRWLYVFLGNRTIGGNWYSNGSKNRK